VIASYRRVRQLDLVIVSGGGQLDDYWGGPWGHPYALLKWGLLAWAARKPYVFLSVGTCALRSTLSTLFIRGALKLAVYRSYRDQGSKDLVNRLGFTRSDPVFPDLAFSYSVPSNGNRRKSVSERLVIGVSPIAYLHPHLWPMSNASVHDAYMKELAVFIASLVRQGHRVVLLPTATSDAVVIKELIHILHVDHGLGQDSAITGPPVSGLDDLFFHLRRVDCMVASRLHGVILSHLAGKPVLAVSYDRKVAAYMTDMAQPEFCLDIHTVTAVSLEKTLHQLLANSERSGAAISERASEFRRLLENQYDAAFSAIEETQSGGRRQRHP
jgi:polysaccharide pyruvyl transferase WcaK-like protein